MPELLIAAGVVAGLVALSLANRFFSVDALLVWSVALMGAGFLVGLPAGLAYHVLLARALAEAGGKPPRWWLRPTSFHEGMDRAALQRLRPWFRVGAAGFLLVLAGCVLLLFLTVRVTLG